MGGPSNKRDKALVQRLRKADFLVQGNRFKEALEQLKDISTSFDQPSPSEEKALFHYLFGYCQWRQGEKKQALGHARGALETYLSFRNFEGIAKCEYLLGALFIDLGNLAQAKEHLEIAVADFKQIRDWASAARSLNRISNLHVIKGELKRAIEYAGQAREYALKAGDRYYELVQHGVMGVCWWLLGNWKQAKSELKDFLIETKQASDSVFYTSGLVNLGHAEFVGGRFKEARKHYLEAARVCLVEDLIGNLKVAFEYLGELGIYEGRFAEAEGYLNKALEIGERVSPYGPIMTQRWRLMGDLRNAKGEPQDALQAYETCESYLIKLPEELERGACFVGRGVAYAKLQQWNLSRACFEKALDVFDQCENDWETAKAVVTSVEVGAYSAKQVTVQLLTAKELFRKLEHPAWEERVEKLMANSPEPLEPLPYFAKKENFEKQEILTALEKAGQNKTRAAELLGIPRQTLQHKIKKHRLDG